MKTRAKTIGIVLSLTLGIGAVAQAQEMANPPATAPSAKKLPNTIGVDISSMTRNPDKTVTLLFHWKDKGGNEQTRSAIINDQTVIGIDGEIKTLDDVNESAIKKKAVATVGDDGVTAISLRMGRKKIVATPDLVARATPKPTPESLAQLAKSDAQLEKRVDGIVAKLNLNDPEKDARVHKVIASDLRAVRDAHNLGFTSDPSVHSDFNAGLAKELTAEQVEQVKDEITINKVPITFKAYHEIVPNLTAEDDKYILDELKAAREESLDVKAIEEVDLIFKEHKKKIQTYLDAHGHNWQQSLKEYDAKQSGTTRPAMD